MVIVPVGEKYPGARIGPMYLRLLTVTLALLLLLPGCARQDSLQHIQSSGKLTVVTRNSPTTYYQDKEGATGYEYALAGLLAEELGVELKIKTRAARGTLPPLGTLLPAHTPGGLRCRDLPAASGGRSRRHVHRGTGGFQPRRVTPRPA
jgi:hypothetical protein